MDSIDNVFTNIRLMIDNVVIKYTKLAKKGDTLAITKSADRYVAAMLGHDTFNSYQIFDSIAIQNAGVTNVKTIEAYVGDKYNIPLEKRDDIVLAERNYVISSYEEKNDYYRMLNGLPNYGEIQFVYVDETIRTELSIGNKPIHLMSNSEIAKLDKTGNLDIIKKANPTMKYLEYLGENKVDIVVARSARNFAILRINKKNVPYKFYEDFGEVYEQSREYFMTALYNQTFSTKYEYYDNFIAWMIMNMTIQRMIVKSFKYGIDRDFFDLPTIKMMFESYNVPFIQDLPINYQQAILKNLNKLLRYKATDKVLYDITSLLGFERAKIVEYYLMKIHKEAPDGNPLFLYKEVDDGNGGTTLIEDTEHMYDLYFQPVELKETNVPLALNDSTQRLAYEDLIIDDPYWWDDEDMRDTIYGNDFNVLESKFIGMTLMYKMTKMLFEIEYAFRMIFDKKSQVEKFTISLPKFFDSKRIDIFTAVIILFALLCRKNSMKGNVLCTPSKILSVYGFNFKADFAEIRKYIKDNNKNIDQNILKYFEQLDVYSAWDINALYENIRDLNDFLVEKMARSQSIKEYEAYKKLFKTLMVTEETRELFTKSDGTIAETFLEYLFDKDYAIGYFVESTDIKDVPEYIDYVIDRINEFIPSLEYLFILNDTTTSLIDSLITLIRFFKSYTTDLTGFNVVYIMDSRYYNMIKLIHDVKSVNKILGIPDSLNLLYKDELAIRKSLIGRDDIKFIDKFMVFAKILLKDKLTVYDVFSLLKTIQLDDDVKLLYADVIKFIHANIKRCDNIQMKSLIAECLGNIKTKDTDKMRDKINEIYSITNVFDNFLLMYNDAIMQIIKTECHNDKIKFDDSKNFIFIEFGAEDFEKLYDKMQKLVGKIYHNDNAMNIYSDMITDMIETMKEVNKIRLDDGNTKYFIKYDPSDIMGLRDKLQNICVKYDRRDYSIKFKDIFRYIVSLYKADDILLKDTFKITKEYDFNSIIPLIEKVNCLVEYKHNDNMSMEYADESNIITKGINVNTTDIYKGDRHKNLIKFDYEDTISFKTIIDKITKITKYKDILKNIKDKLECDTEVSSKDLIKFKDFYDYISKLDLLKDELKYNGTVQHIEEIMNITDNINISYNEMISNIKSEISDNDSIPLYEKIKIVYNE